MTGFPQLTDGKRFENRSGQARAFSLRVDLENREHVLPRLKYGDEMAASRASNRREMNQSARKPITRAQVMPRVANNVGRTGEGKMKSNDGFPE